MARTLMIPAPSGIGTVRIRDRRRTRRPPRGAIVMERTTAWRSFDALPAHLRQPDAVPAIVKAPNWLTRDDLRHFTMSFAAFFTAAMIFLG